MKIGILQTGRAPSILIRRHGDYDDMLVRLLAGNQQLTFQTFAVMDGVFPASAEHADGWLITGSKCAVYEPHPWIAPLQKFLLNAHTRTVPVVGVCFGHQILAQALGGKVEKYPGGWSIGPANYQTNTNTERIFAWHQDQITKPPDNATIIGSSDFCKYAMIEYGNHALSIQPHPEFTPGFMQDLLEIRKKYLPPNIARQAQQAIENPGTLTSSRLADRIAGFFLACDNMPDNNANQLTTRTTDS